MSNSYKHQPLSEEADLLDFEAGHQEFGVTETRPAEFSSTPSMIPMGQMNTGARESQLGLASVATGLPAGLSEATSMVLPSFLKNAAHPYVCLFHLLFKGLSVFTYWIIYMLTKDIVITFILTTICLGLDFWTVKNVTGRILVGLRWWNRVNEDGSSEWVFESGSRDVSSLDKNVFWIGLYVFPLYWILAAISNFLSFSPNFVMLNIMGLMFSGTNAMGYTKCSRSGQKAVQDWATNTAMRVITSNVVSNVSTAAR